MDDSVADILDAIDASTLSGLEAAQSPEKFPEKSDAQNRGKRSWRGLSALKAQASMQDKLLEK